MTKKCKKEKERAKSKKTFEKINLVKVPIFYSSYKFNRKSCRDCYKYYKMYIIKQMQIIK